MKAPIITLLRFQPTTTGKRLVTVDGLSPCLDGKGRYRLTPGAYRQVYDRTERVPGDDNRLHVPELPDLSCAGLDPVTIGRQWAESSLKEFEYKNRYRGRQLAYMSPGWTGTDEYACLLLGFLRDTNHPEGMALSHLVSEAAAYRWRELQMDAGVALAADVIKASVQPVHAAVLRVEERAARALNDGAIAVAMAVAPVCADTRRLSREIRHKVDATRSQVLSAVRKFHATFNAVAAKAAQRKG